MGWFVEIIAEAYRLKGDPRASKSPSTPSKGETGRDFHPPFIDSCDTVWLTFSATIVRSSGKRLNNRESREPKMDNRECRSDDVCLKRDDADR